ncbi:hypothetical protein JV16_02773 [Anoxybacillus ayderensis]|uniref:Uncharacterized protein n=1 Tax=Anoxybacillus ayderensis TaxID=265546 RepID=A0A0D0HQD6_9BACL|nr:hypothetical protein C289_0529 [Anoxybacillus ayderensis]KIP20093.1 hypothetical protein JV16_02773 [Anoxybacillus ayderensis]
MDEQIDQWMETITNGLFCGVLFFCIPYFIYVLWQCM